MQFSVIERLALAVAVFLPSDAVIVNVVAATGSDDVPDMTPVLDDMTKPAGKAGLIEYVTVPEKLVATKALVGVIATPRLAATVCVAGLIPVTVSVSVAVATPLVPPVPVRV